jgi:hypothetical protein
VHQYRPYGLFKNYIEVYVPRAAEVRRVDVDARPAPFFKAMEDGYVAIGTYVEIPRGELTTVTVSYDLELEGARYALELRPQPQAHDSELQVAVAQPRGWTAEGPGRQRDGVLRYEGTFDETLRWRAAPSDATGLTALWRGARAFWTQPVL